MAYVFRRPWQPTQPRHLYPWFVAPPPPVVVVPTGGGKKKKKPVRPIWDIQREKEAAAQAAAPALPVTVVAAPDIAPTAKPTAAAQTPSEWRAPQLIPPLPVGEPRPQQPIRSRARTRITEADDTATVTVSAPATIGARFQEAEDYVDASASAPATGIATFSDEDEQATASATVLITARAKIADDADRIIAASKISPFTLDDDDEDVLLALVHDLD